MKEIQKVVQKLSREQKSAFSGGDGAGGRRRPKRYETSPLYPGDLIKNI